MTYGRTSDRYITLTSRDGSWAIENHDLAQKFGKNRRFVSGDMLADRHTDTQACTIQYLLSL